MIMKHSLLLLLMWLCVLPAFANESEDSGNTKRTKTFQETFSVSKSDRLEIDNKYGNITVTHWARNEVSIKVLVKVESSSASYTAAQIDAITVRMEKYGSTVSARTEFSSRNRRNHVSVKYNNMEVRYEVTMPSWLPCELSQKYGNIYMPESNPALCDLEAKYGSVNGGNFSGDLIVDVKYGDLKIGNVGSIDLTLGYCNNSEISNATSINATLKYSTLRMRKANTIDIDASYSKLRATEVSEAVIGLKYTNFRLSNLTRSMECTSLSYGTIDIENLSPDFKSVDVESRYGTLNVSLPSSASFRVKASDMKYGRCAVNGFDVRHRAEYGNEKSGFDSRKVQNNSYNLEVNGGRGGLINFIGNNYGNIHVNAK